MSDVWPSIVMVFVFVLIGGVFSGAEIALVSLREDRSGRWPSTAGVGTPSSDC